MMHTLMSFIGTIGYNMKGSGVKELVGAVYSGMANIFNGKAWPEVNASLPYGRRCTSSRLLAERREKS